MSAEIYWRRTRMSWSTRSVVHANVERGLRHRPSEGAVSLSFLQSLIIDLLTGQYSHSAGRCLWCEVNARSSRRTRAHPSYIFATMSPGWTPIISLGTHPTSSPTFGNSQGVERTTFPSASGRLGLARNAAKKEGCQPLHICPARSAGAHPLRISHLFCGFSCR